MDRAYYANHSSYFLKQDPDSVLGALTRHHDFALEDLQRNAWLAQIDILQHHLQLYPNSYVAFEYAIPRMGKWVDVIVLISGSVVVLEFKVGEDHHSVARPGGGLRPGSQELSRAKPRSSVCARSCRDECQVDK